MSVVWSVLQGCAPPAEPVFPHPDLSSHAPVGATGEEVHLPPIVLHLTPPTPSSAFRWETETAGLATVMLEVGLSEIDGVVVEVDGHERSPGTRMLVGTPERWTGRVALGSDPNALDVELELCRPDGLRCTSTSATGTREDPQKAVPELLRFASSELGRGPAAGTFGQWSLPISGDTYAVLICGRSAATWYGLLPAPTPDQLDTTRDAIARAVLIDPSMAIGQWLLGRREAEEEHWSEALQALTSAREGRPFQPVFLADQAAALAGSGKLAAAADAWDGIVELTPQDARFRLARAHALLDARRLDDARAAIDRLLADWSADPGVAEARVALADAAGEVEGTDELLRHWANTDPMAPEPVRRRIQLRVRDGRYQEAWDMLAELRRREAFLLADGFTVPLGVALGRWNDAAEAAARTGRPDVAARIRARRDLAADPAHPVEGLLDWDRSPEARVAMGRAALLAGQPSEAAERVEEAARRAPWSPDVLALQADTLAALGRAEPAQATRRRLAAIEPAAPVALPSARE
ncbi:MAG: tetratricopeptide repeat protein [Alphaproteobacteria bacterium]|nr:tetratricopeptide repeat protein [Alphaproteobacteria bacterium]